MNGAESLVRTLLAGGVDTCFANPGTSEMHFVAALDRVPGMRCVLGLFEGVVTGAADGYARMADKPAATLLHLGPGFGNGIANIHNAGRAGSPMINIVGDHATYHRAFDAPLTSDIEGLAAPVSHWIKTSPDAQSVATDGAAAIAAALKPPGQIATLILPANTAWDEADGPAEAVAAARRSEVSDEAIQGAFQVLKAGEPSVLFMTGQSLREEALRQAGRIAAVTGARLMAQTNNGREERGAGRVNVERLPYPLDQALTALDGIKHIILVGAKAPVAFFAYPGKPSVLYPEGCNIHTLATREEDCVPALSQLSDRLGAPPAGVGVTDHEKTELPSGALSPQSIAQSVAALLPDQGIVVDEGISSGRLVPEMTRSSAPHDWLQICGGAIGIGMPLSVGAAVACPDRRVLGLQADGSGMYTLQALWTQARENLNVTTVVFANRRYASLHHELANVGAGNPGRRALDMLDLDRPDLDWVKLAQGMGVAAEAANDAPSFNRLLDYGLRSDGPFLIQANL
ncbi:MAG: acetolactate synthase large subunit [Pseudomonadota bacterium]